ncbi:unnamed protein product [Rangifer tarandus platyrhynchus]|uniref:Uncharacterized protein n=1 Tax=Rangifer tarandus platyrhynchus TaxID=3082113 RepID=A0AC60A8B9_RANTA
MFSSYFEPGGGHSLFLRTPPGGAESSAVKGVSSGCRGGPTRWLRSRPPRSGYASVPRFWTTGKDGRDPTRDHTGVSGRSTGARGRYPPGKSREGPGKPQGRAGLLHPRLRLGKLSF